MTAVLNHPYMSMVCRFVGLRAYPADAFGCHGDNLPPKKLLSFKGSLWAPNEAAFLQGTGVGVQDVAVVLRRSDQSMLPPVSPKSSAAGDGGGADHTWKAINTATRLCRAHPEG